MPADGLGRILALLSDGREPGGTRRLCEVAAEVSAASGAGIMVLADGRPQGTLCTTNSVSDLIEDLQYTLGEGPCVDAHRFGKAVVEPDLAAPDLPRWQAFAPRAVEAGARAVFGFPVRLGAARLGAVNLYRDRPGPLSHDQHAAALVVADVAAYTILLLQAGAAPGEVAAELEREANFKLVVHQAAGMVSVQLDVSVGDALVRLRAHAFRTDRPVADVARDVVSRALRLDGAADE